MVRVLMVDDSPIVTKMVSSYLSERGYMVDVTNSPFGVTKKIKEFRPGIILMDLGLPGLSGERLIEICRKREDTAGIRIILFSSANEELMAGMVEEGMADDYFVKGSSLNDLETKIRKVAP